MATPIGNLGDLVAAGGRDAARRRRDRGRGHPAHPRRCCRTRACPAGRRLVAVHAHNERARAAELVERIRGGRPRRVRVPTPGCRGSPTPASGSCACASTPGCGSSWCRGRARRCRPLVLSGLPTARFVVEGFLPRSGRDRAERLAEVARERAHDGDLRGAAPGRGHARRPRRGLRRRPAGRDRPRAHQALRGGVAGHARRRRRPRRRARAARRARAGARRRAAGRRGRRRRARGRGRERARRRRVGTGRGRRRRRAISASPSAAPTTSPSASAATIDAQRRRRERLKAASVSWPGGPAVLRDDADLLRQRRAAHRARVHDGRGRRAGPVAAALGRRRRLPHRHRRARAEDPAGGRGARRHPAGVGRPDERAVPRDLEAARHHERRLHPHDRAAPLRGGRSEFLQRVYDNGYIELDTYEGLYCVACEAYYTEDELVERATARSTTGPSSASPRRTTSSSSRASRTALLEHYAAHPDAVQPESRAQRGARLHQAGPARLLDEPHVDHVGHPAAVGRAPRHLRVVRRAVQLLHRGRLRRPTARASTATGRPTTTSIGKDILRFHAVYWPAMLMAAGEAPPKHVFAHGYLLVGGEKMSKTRLNQIAPADLVAEFGSDGFRYHFLADQRFGPDGDFSLRGDGRALQRRSREQLRQPREPRAEHGGELLRRRRARRRAPNGPLAAAATQAFDRMTAAMTQLDFDDRVRRGVGADPRHEHATSRTREPWKLNKAGDAAATAAVLGDCLEALRIVALLASPVIPRGVRRAVAPPRPPRHARGPAPPRRRRLGPAPRRRRPGEGRPALPPPRPWTAVTRRPDAVGRLALPPADGDGRGRRRDRPGPRRRRRGDGRASAPTSRRRARRSTSRPVIPTSTRPSGSIRTTRRASTPSGTTLVALATSPRVVAVGEAGFDFHYMHSPPDAQDAAFRAQIRLAQPPRPRARDPLARSVGRHLPRARRRRRPGAHGVPLLHRRSERSRPRARPRRRALVQRHRVVQVGRRRARRGRARCPPTGSSWRPTRPYLAPVPHRGKENEPAFDRRGRRGAGRRGRPRPGRRRRVDRGRRRRLARPVLIVRRPAGYGSRRDLGGGDRPRGTRAAAQPRPQSSTPPGEPDASARRGAAVARARRAARRAELAPAPRRRRAPRARGPHRHVAGGDRGPLGATRRRRGRAAVAGPRPPARRHRVAPTPTTDELDDLPSIEELLTSPWEAPPSPARAEPHDATTWLPLPEPDALPDAETAGASGQGRGPATRRHSRARAWAAGIAVLVVVTVLAAALRPQPRRQRPDERRAAGRRHAPHRRGRERHRRRAAAGAAREARPARPRDPVAHRAELRDGQAVSVLRAFPITRDLDGAVTTVYTAYVSPSDYLRRDLRGDDDYVFRSKPDRLQAKSTITLRTPHSGTLMVDGQPVTYDDVPALDVRELLAQYSVELGPEDYVMRGTAGRAGGHAPRRRRQLHRRARRPRARARGRRVHAARRASPRPHHERHRPAARRSRQGGHEDHRRTRSPASTAR